MAFINFGMRRQQFFDKHYDKQSFLQRQAFPVDSFSWQDLDNALYSWEPQGKQIRLFKNGPVAPEKFTEPYMELSEQRTRLVKDVLYQYMKEGATLVLNKLQLHNTIIHDYCMNIAQFIGEKTNANAYAAFGGDGSFGKHWDTHDVFALQLIGRKHWKLYQPTFEQPLAHQKSTNHKAECPQVPVLDMVLEAGDLLYIPRGWWHEALPLEGEPTFHIAVGTFPPRVIDYLVWLCTSQLPQYLEGRQSLNPYLDTESTMQAVTDKLINLLNDPAMLQNFEQAVSEQQRVRSRFGIANLAKQYQAESDTESQCMAARLNSFTPVFRDQDSLMVNGFKLNVDEPSREFISSLAAENFNGVIANESLYSTKQQQFLKRLHEYDVVEWVGK